MRALGRPCRALRRVRQPVLRHIGGVKIETLKPVVVVHSGSVRAAGFWESAGRSSARARGGCRRSAFSECCTVPVECRLPSSHLRHPDVPVQPQPCRTSRRRGFFARYRFAITYLGWPERSFTAPGGVPATRPTSPRLDSTRHRRRGSAQRSGWSRPGTPALPAASELDPMVFLAVAEALLTLSGRSSTRRLSFRISHSCTS